MNIISRISAYPQCNHYQKRAMKIKCAIIGLFLLCLAANLSAQETTDWRDYNGYKWNEYNRSKYFGAYFKVNYVVSVMYDGKNVGARMANYMKSMLDPTIPPFVREEEESSQAGSQLIKELNWLLDKVTPYEDYGGITIGQYLNGLDEFYQDSENIPVPIPMAMISVKMKVKGEPKEEIDNYIAELRKQYSEAKNE